MMDIQHFSDFNGTNENFVTTITRREIAMARADIAALVVEKVAQSIADQFLEKHRAILLEGIDQEEIINRVLKGVAEATIEAWKKS